MRGWAARYRRHTPLQLGEEGLYGDVQKVDKATLDKLVFKFFSYHRYEIYNSYYC